MYEVIGMRASRAMRVLWMLEEAGLPYRHIPAKPRDADAAAANPSGKIPALRDGDAVITDSVAIMTYLADKHGATGWYPVDLEQRALVDQWLDWNQTRLTPATEKIAYNVLFAGDKADEQAIESGKAALEKIMPILDGALHATGWMAEERPSLCDVAVATNIAYLELCAYGLDAYPAVLAWYSRLRERESFRKTAPPAVP